MWTHLGIQVVLILVYFLPGGLIWNRVEPVIFSVPFSVVVTAVVLPLCFSVNMLLYVVRHWSDDLGVASEVRRTGALPRPAATDAQEH